nr:MAG TPA: hypothetical protein [Caudoviricetes sp.]
MAKFFIFDNPSFSRLLFNLSTICPNVGSFYPG